MFREGLKGDGIECLVPGIFSKKMGPATGRKTVDRGMFLEQGLPAQARLAITVPSKLKYNPVRFFVPF